MARLVLTTVIVLALFEIVYGIGIYLNELTSPKLPQIKKAINAIEPNDR